MNIYLCVLVEPTAEDIQRELSLEFSSEFNRLLVIRIEDAQGLKNADSFGSKSDPYVKVQWPKNAVVSQKDVWTTTVDDCLDPTWGEEFAVLIGPDVSTFDLCVKDSDIGLDAVLATHTVTIDDAKSLHAKQVALNPQGSLRYAYRVVPLEVALAEAAAPGPDSDAVINCPFDRILHIGIRGAFKLKDADAIGTSDSYTMVKFTDEKDNVSGGKTTQTEVMSDGENPVWGAGFTYLLKPVINELALKVYDKDKFTRDDVLGKIMVGVKPEVVDQALTPLDTQGDIMYDLKCFSLRPYYIGAGALPDSVGTYNPLPPSSLGIWHTFDLQLTFISLNVLPCVYMKTYFTTYYIFQRILLLGEPWRVLPQ